MIMVSNDVVDGSPSPRFYRPAWYPTRHFRCRQTLTGLSDSKATVALLTGTGLCFFSSFCFGHELGDVRVTIVSVR